VLSRPSLVAPTAAAKLPLTLSHIQRAAGCSSGCGGCAIIKFISSKSVMVTSGNGGSRHGVCFQAAVDVVQLAEAMLDEAYSCRAAPTLAHNPTAT
jgi:bacterioferritin-associated ferredoxin